MHYQFHSGGRKEESQGKEEPRGIEEMLLDRIPSEALTSYPPSTTKATDDELCEEAIDVTIIEEWVGRVETARQAVEKLG